jgi:hypothetical protein
MEGFMGYINSIYRLAQTSLYYGSIWLKFEVPSNV